jgi:hypothetical protein
VERAHRFERGPFSAECPGIFFGISGSVSTNIASTTMATRLAYPTRVTRRGKPSWEFAGPFRFFGQSLEPINFNSELFDLSLLLADNLQEQANGLVPFAGWNTSFEFINI